MTLRADARRNHDRIIEIATAHFEREGVTAPLDAIAAEAGVGAGTLYRRFPTRESLIGAVLAASHDRLLDCADEQRSNPDPCAALDIWLTALRGHLTTFSGVSEPVLRAIKQTGSPLNVTCYTLIAITGDLLRTAQDRGLVRKEIAAGELFLMTLALSWVEDKAGLYGATLERLQVILRQGYQTTAPD